ncbi:protein FAR1-RELATED SEQUENCE 5-like [Rhododendron vialii]|uniref:protein FAR1-RELATED SEQUENCE 5-like n=1 Tax=Rhododendron vialii TaxID=182163 RepID=UPI00265E96E0|nr:protein FAR1-RELATED SEQUENCE 5-like [Rhododendron vialii]
MEEEDSVSINPTPLFRPPPPRTQTLDDIQLLSPSSSQLCEESTNFCQLYTPQVKNEVIPRIDQHFRNLEDVYAFYNNYAFHAGFSVRINSSKMDKNGETTRKDYVCFKEGERRISKATTTRRRGLTREKCGAKLVVVRAWSSEGFVVSNFVEGHSHSLTTPRKTHLLKSHRRISDAQKSLTQHLAAANVPPHQQMSILELQAGGLGNVGFLPQDLYNKNRDERNCVDGYDADMLYEYFETEQQKNLNFYFTMEKDDEGRMSHCFWADATCRKSYQYFGDVVVLDTTYNTNRYSMIFAPILGVNHHRQTTLFGCGFLCNESSDSFEWLFKEWLKAMPGIPPKMIITDQDLAMTKAFANVLPNTHHRYCIWHIVSKFSSKISALSYKEHYDDFKGCMWNSESPEEFDRRWEDIVTKSNLSDSEWLQSIYEIRDRWVPAYTKHIFSAHMTSSQRAESSHAFFKRYVSKENTMLDFVLRFERALSRIRHNELNLDHKDVNEKAFLKTSSFMEKGMSELYTQSIFYMFQDEIFQINAYVVTSRHEDEHRCLWDIRRPDMEGSRSREISVEKSSNLVSCSCKMFDFDGIPCRHMLAYFSRMQIMELPTKYILRRWTKSTKASRVMDDLGSVGKEICDRSVLVRRQGLFQLACNVIDEGVLDEEGTEVVSKHLLLAKDELAVLRSSREPRPASVIEMSISNGSQHSFNEPLQVRAKGCGKRLKGGKERAVKKSRKCHGCGLIGQSHDKRNCPKLLNISSQDVRLDDDDDDMSNNDDE